ncbi:unnamed protein product [Cyprideis torosa]|uniref:Cytochrome c oxidase subunit 2 n=1 Tax=Cyprideis torosa TaxID=163714 RepID=A0A7R8W3Q6_9CRUS|nr:unnamed protein product [Cyprideis torosa]CAG0878779.1 unnamed protein product [Cyprideis torosa]
MAGWDALNMTQGVTNISKEVYGIHMMIFWVCCVIGVAVFAVMFYSMWAHRKSRGAVAAKFHESTVVEIVWTAIPFVILIGVAIPSAKTLIAMEDTSNSELTIKVTGYQWRWHYDYLDSGVNFFSALDPEHNAARQLGADVDVSKIDNYLREVDNPLVVPVGVKIRLLHTANDVIHSWWVPELALKKDAIPGFVNENWTVIEEPGVFRGKCAELCGRDHGFMPVVVHAVSQEDFAVWLAEQQQASASSEISEQSPKAAVVASESMQPAARLALN